MVREGEQFMLHDQGGEKGPYTVLGRLLDRGMESSYYELQRNGVSQSAYATEQWLRAGLRPGLHGEVGWLPVIPY